MRTSRRRSGFAAPLLFAGLCAATVATTLGAGLLAALIALGRSPGGCDTGPAGGAAGRLIAQLPPGGGATVGATEYGGPGDPSSTTHGARGDDLLAHPDTYAELGGRTWETARAMGGLAYLTPLRITVGRVSVLARKRDFGFGGPPVGGRPRAIDLWWQLAGRLGIPYEGGLWSGAVRVERPPETGATSLLGLASPQDPTTSAPSAPCDGSPALTAGPRAVIGPGGGAAAPASAPAVVQAMIAAGNAIVGRPYVYGGGHDRPLSELSSTYDCSSSIEHLLWGGGLVSSGFTVDSGALEQWGAPGPGRWVTVYASPSHVFMYVAGLRWDTWNAGGPDDGGGVIGWHPLVRSAAGFVARHPEGL